MWPLLRAGDVLVAREPQPSPRRGDVVVFHPPESREGLVFVHRVTDVAPEGLSTRGDNNPRPDPWRIEPDRVLGVVNTLRRGGRDRRVRGGLLGLWQFRLCRVRRAATVMSRHVFRRAYAAVRSSRLLARLWQPRVAALRIATGRGAMVKYVWRNRTVARWWPEQGRFACRKPFDLFLTSPDASGRVGATAGGEGCASKAQTSP